MAAKPDAPVIRFELEHADGSIWRLTGEEARLHVEQINGLCAVACAHGAYQGREPKWEFLAAPSPRENTP